MTRAGGRADFSWLVLAATACLLLGAVFFYLNSSRRPNVPNAGIAASNPPVASPPPVFEPPLPSGTAVPAAEIGIIIDDFGASWANVDRCLALPVEIAVAVIPHLASSVRVAEAAHARGFDVFLHQPMQPHGYPREDPGRYGIYLRQSPEEISAILQENIASLRVPLAGVNNHMGSLATETPRVMEPFFDAFPRRLIFLDSRTSVRSIAYDAARSRGISALKNNVFLDAVRDSAAIVRAFDQLERQARSHKFAIGIGHVESPETLRVLEERLPRLPQEGIRLVRLSHLIARPRT